MSHASTRVNFLFLRQVDNFAIATPDRHTADLVMNLIDNRLTLPIKRQRYLVMYIGIDIIQTRDYIKITIRTFVEKIFEHHIATWMKTSYPTPNRSTPLLTNASWLKKFNSAVGDSDKAAQSSLAKWMQLAYQPGVGELIWPMTTCCPDLAYTSVKLSQSNTCPHKIHYHGLKHALKYLYNSHNTGIYFWRTTPHLKHPFGTPPQIHSNKKDIILDDHTQFDPLIAHAYANLDWATCPKTWCSFGGVCVCLASGTSAYKCRFQPTVTGSSTEAEFMAAFDARKNDPLHLKPSMGSCHTTGGCYSPFWGQQRMHRNGQRPKAHLKNKTHGYKILLLCERVKHNLMIIDRIDTSINMADHLTKALQPTLFHRHTNFLLGHIPPTYSLVYKSIV